MRARRRQVARHGTPLSFEQRWYLSSGHGPGFDGGDAEARAAWQAVRDEMIEKERRLRPGWRPFAFWRFDVGRPDLIRADPGEAIDPADYPSACPDRVTVPNANGSVSQQPHGGEHVEWCYVAARDQRLHERRLAYLVARDLLLPGENPLQGGPDHQRVEPRARL